MRNTANNRRNPDIGTAKQCARADSAGAVPAPAAKTDFMQAALSEAQKAAAAGEVPIGAVVVRHGQIIAAAHNLTRGHSATAHRRATPPDPTAHAEMRVLRMACHALGQERLSDCDLYVSLEPCTMCAAAIAFARIRRLYYAAPDPKGGAVEHNSRFFHSAACFHTPELYPSLHEQESAALLRQFFRTQRDKTPEPR